MGTATSIEWDDKEFARVLERLPNDGTIDARGVWITAERLARILEAAPSDPEYHGWSFLNATFEGAVFERGARFDHVAFGEEASFDRARFEGDATFDWTIFKGDARFRSASFGGEAGFNALSVTGNTGFEEVGFAADALFNLAIFEGEASFDRATFEGETRFLSGSFEGAASFRGARFQGDTRLFPDFEAAARFGEVRFEGALFSSATFDYVEFHNGTFEGETTFYSSLTCRSASFNGATFEVARDLGPVVAAEAVDLKRAVFAAPVRIEVSAQTLDCSRVQFRRGTDILVRRADVVLDDADFGEPSMLAPLQEVPEGETASSEQQGSDEEAMARVVSVRRAKLANLTIAGADLRACRFEGAHGLDRLRVEQVRFAEPPRGWRWSTRGLPIRWTRRQVIAEEQQWRAEVAGATGWYGPEVQAISAVASAPQAPDQIAAIYRALRKGREDGKDEPGAADFYYGEMEMRRQGTRARNTRRPTGERLVLWLYWLVSGYGLRASRAVTALAITVVVFAVFFDWWGFRPDRGFGRTLLFSIQSSSSLFRVPETKGFALTPGGELLQVALRLLGPLFFGLALFSLRGRVKR